MKKLTLIVTAVALLFVFQSHAQPRSSDSIVKGWHIYKEQNTGKKCTAEYTGSFANGNTGWDIDTDPKDGKAAFENDMLHILFNTDLPKGDFQFGGVSLESPFDNLDQHDFSFATTIESKITNSFSCGISYGDMRKGSFYRVGIVNKANRVIFEHFNDGLFVNDTDFDIARFSRTGANELRIDKHGTTTSIYINGGLIGQLENLSVVGKTIAIFSMGCRANTDAYFSSFKMRTMPTAIRPGVIPVKYKNGTYTLNAQLNEVLAIDFIFDPGASDVSISPDVALTLLRTGTIKNEDWLPGAYYKFADGSTAKSRRFKLRSVKIGDRVIKNVACSISNSVDAPMLLGQSVLNRLGKYTFDNQNRSIKIE